MQVLTRPLPVSAAATAGGAENGALRHGAAADKRGAAAVGEALRTIRVGGAAASSAFQVLWGPPLCRLSSTCALPATARISPERVSEKVRE